MDIFIRITPRFLPRVENIFILQNLRMTSSDRATVVAAAVGAVVLVMLAGKVVWRSLPSTPPATSKGRRRRRGLVARQPLPAINACADEQASLRPGERLVWHFRHGESTANLAERQAIQADTARGDGLTTERKRHESDAAYADAPLTDVGIQQAERKRHEISGC